MADPVRAVVAGLMVVITLMAGTTIVDDIVATEDGIDQRNDDLALLGDTGQFVQVPDKDGEGTNEVVRDSRGHAINLTGADDSFVESQDSFTIAEDDNWTISVWARVDSEAANDDMTAVSANGRVLINYNGSQGNWSVWYFDEGSRDSHIVNVSAPNQPGNFTNVIAASNGTHLTIYRNNTQGDIKDITTSNIAGAPVDNTNWNGRIDEVRTFDDNLTSAQRQSLVDSPVRPEAGTDRTARIMFDEPTKDSQSIFFTSTRLDQFNATFSSGLDGTVLSEGTDYEWDADGPRIKPLAGGALEDAPVAYVEYDFERALAGVLDSWADFTRMAALVPLMIIAFFIIIRMRG